MFTTEVTLVDEETGSADLLRFVMNDVDAVYAHAEHVRDITVPAYIRLSDGEPLPAELETPIAWRGWVRLDAVEGWDVDLENDECADLEAEDRGLDDDARVILLRGVAEECRRAWLVYLRDDPDLLLRVALGASMLRVAQLTRLANEARDALAEAMGSDEDTERDALTLRFSNASLALRRAEDERNAYGEAVARKAKG